MTRCYILFGSNQGDKKRLLEEACRLLQERCGLLAEQSSAYLSEPWGFETDAWFLNVLLVVETELGPDALMDALMDIEATLGRKRDADAQGYADRPIDLDILYYGDQVVQTEKVTTPHPRLHLRRFALVPLCEIIPDFLHPEFQLSQQQLLDRCPDASTVKPFHHEL